MPLSTSLTAQDAPTSSSSLDDIAILPRTTDVESQPLPLKQTTGATVDAHIADVRPLDWLPARLPFLSHGLAYRIFSFFRGPRPTHSLTLRSWKYQTQVENAVLRWTRPILKFKWLLVPLYLIVWLIAVSLLVKESWFSSSTSSGAPSLIGTSAAFWLPNAQCGLNGSDCAPFSNNTFAFRCPANPIIKLLNQRAVGAQEINLKTLLVGGGDSLATYRADSWLCAAAYQQGLVSDIWGGCAVAQQIGSFTNFLPLDKRGLTSIAFDTVFPSAYRLDVHSGGGHCKDLKYPILAFNVCMLWIFAIFLRPKAALLYWVCFCVGFWQIAVTLSPPSFSTSFGTFLPALFFGYAFWRTTYRFLLPPFDALLLERSVLFVGLFWVGIMMDRTIETWIQVDRLTASDVNKTGTLPAVIVVGILALCVVLNQFRVFRNTGWLLWYLQWYIAGGTVVGVLAALPGLTLRIHHYILAMVLIPLVAFPTRLSLMAGAFIFGMFLNGAAIWGFDSMLQTAAELRRDAALGSDLPVWHALTTVPALGNISWAAIPFQSSASWSAFGLIIDDVLYWTGNLTNFNVSSLDPSLPHYFRLAYQAKDGSFGDFTRAALRMPNATWIPPEPGPG